MDVVNDFWFFTFFSFFVLNEFFTNENITDTHLYVFRIKYDWAFTVGLSILNFSSITSKLQLQSFLI